MAADHTYRSIFEQLIPEIFHNYTTHYFSNPALDKQKITEGYMEWAVNSINAANNLHVLAYGHKKPVGFITCSYT